MYQPISSVTAVEGEPPVVFAGRENGHIAKFANATDLSQPTLSIEGHKGAVTSLFAVSADDVYSASTDGTVKQWNFAPEVEGKRETRCVHFGASLRSLSIVAETIYAGGNNGVLYVATGAEISSWHGHQDAIVSLHQLEGLVATGSYDNQARVWDSTGRCLFVLVGHSNFVRQVQLLSSNVVVTVGGDETVRLWQLPEASQTIEGDAIATQHAGKEGDENALEGTSTATKQVISKPIIVRPAAVIGYSGTVLSSSVSGPNTFLGAADGALFSIQTRDLLRVVQDFQQRNRDVVRDEGRRVEKERIERANMLRSKLRKTLKNKRKELKLIEKQVSAAAAAEKLRLARERAAENEEDEPPVEEPQAEEEGGDEAALSPEHEEELAAFTASQEQLTNNKIEEGKRLAAKRIEDVAPIAQRVYQSDASSFFRAPFSRHYKGGNDGVQGLAVIGKTAFISQGSIVLPVAVTPGVTTL